MAPVRVILVIGIVVLVVAFLFVAALAIGEVVRPLPASCADYGGPSALLPGGCHKNVVIYIFALALLGSGVGVLWRKLGR